MSASFWLFGVSVKDGYLLVFSSARASHSPLYLKAETRVETELELNPDGGAKPQVIKQGVGIEL